MIQKETMIIKKQLYMQNGNKGVKYEEVINFITMFCDIIKM